MPKDPELRKIYVGILATIISASLIGWGSWITTYAMSHRERIVAIEQCVKYDKESALEMKTRLRDIEHKLDEIVERLPAGKSRRSPHE